MKKVNSTLWNIVEVLSIKNKGKLVQEIIYDELVRKITEQLNAIRDVLALIGLLPRLQETIETAGNIVEIHQRDSPKIFFEKC